MLDRLRKNVVYFVSGVVGVGLGLIPVVIVAILVAILVAHAKVELHLPLEDEMARELSYGTLSLLIAFLVSKNIDISMAINGAVDSVRTTAVELASLAHTLSGDTPECIQEVDEITHASLLFLETVLTETTTKGETVDDGMLATLRAIQRLKTLRLIEPAVVPVFVHAASACYDAHSQLWTLRELSGTPASIKVTIYAITLFNITDTLSMMHAGTGERVGAACFIAIASIGAYAISSIVRDPLDYAITSGKARSMVADSERVVQSLRAGRCLYPQNIASVLQTSRSTTMRFRR